MKRTDKQLTEEDAMELAKILIPKATWLMPKYCGFMNSYLITCTESAQGYIKCDTLKVQIEWIINPIAYTAKAIELGYYKP